MVKAHDILGMNARQQEYVSLNSATAKAFCSSKYATKVLLANRTIGTAQIYGVLTSIEDVNEFEWHTLEKNFVIKPTNGNAGKGVAVFRKKIENTETWLDTQNAHWSLDEIKLHCFDILAGQYSTYGTNHQVIVEERVPIHSSFDKYAYQGTPDVRVIVYNHVPVMAMLRLPTKESQGRANLHQGALGVGVDIATGITTSAITGDGRPIQFLPDSKRKLNGIRLPFWKKTLQTAVEAADAAGLAFCGVDLFMSEEKGPVVVELNANPGLSIQLANRAGLRRRLERVRDLNVLSADHGVRIGMTLFAESFADKIKAEDGLVILPFREKITVYDDIKENSKHANEVEALMNTGRFRSAISRQLAEEFGLVQVEDLLWYQSERDEAKAPVIEVTIKIRSRKIKTGMVVLKRLDKSPYKLEIGRNDLTGFLVGENE
jgi:alpha-L-glutamate ligase-like protein